MNKSFKLVEQFEMFYNDSKTVLQDTLYSLQDYHERAISSPALSLSMRDFLRRIFLLAPIFYAARKGRLVNGVYLAFFLLRSLIKKQLKLRTLQSLASYRSRLYL